jgi:hypothetical protein
VPGGGRRRDRRQRRHVQPELTVAVDGVRFNDATYNFETGTRPTPADQCKNGGWQQFNDPAFKNQGDCVSYVATGKNSGNGLGRTHDGRGAYGGAPLGRAPAARSAILPVVPKLEISIDYTSDEELVDLLDEIRNLWDSFEDGVVDVGPVLRSRFGATFLAADQAAREAAA